MLQGGLTVGLQPGHSGILVLHEETPSPQVLGTDRHVISGSPDLKQVRWDAGSGILSGSSATIPRVGYGLALRIPPGYELRQAIAAGHPAEIDRRGERFALVTFDPGQSTSLDTNVANVRRLELICHYVDGWFSTTRALWANPRLVRAGD